MDPPGNSLDLETAPETCWRKYAIKYPVRQNEGEKVWLFATEKPTDPDMVLCQVSDWDLVQTIYSCHCSNYEHWNEIASIQAHLKSEGHRNWALVRVFWFLNLYYITDSYI